MGQTAMWIMPRRVYNPPKTIFRLRFAQSPKVTDRKAMVRGTSQLVNASPIAKRAHLSFASDFTFIEFIKSRYTIYRVVATMQVC